MAREDVATELGRIAAEMDEVARRWSAVEADSPGPALLSHWRTRLVLAAMELEPPDTTSGGSAGQ